MKTVFTDTAALIALGDKSDRFHQQAVFVRNRLKKLRTYFITTNAVILELTGYFSQSGKRAVAVNLTEAIFHSEKWRYIVADDVLMNRGFERYKRMQDKNWSLTDCIGMVVAEDYGIIDIFTTDHHFEQAGFNILLKDKNIS